jgi:hypothetical protein
MTVTPPTQIAGIDQTGIIVPQARSPPFLAQAFWSCRLMARCF